MTAGKTVTELMESRDERVRLDAAKYYTARRMGWKETNVNEQVGKDGGPIDAKRKMIVEQAVTNDVLDMGLLQQTAEPARQILEVETIDVVADKGYFKSEDIEACEKAGLTPHVPKPQRGAAVANGFFRKDEFRYDAAQDAYVCPGRHELKPTMACCDNAWQHREPLLR
jgi:hypothetical protein